VSLADLVFAPGPAAVVQLEVGQLAVSGVGDRAGELVPLDVGEPQLGSEVGRSLRTMTRIRAGQEARSSRPVSSGTPAPGRAWPSAS
jgi:hypothetical protein